MARFVSACLLGSCIFVCSCISRPLDISRAIDLEGKLVLEAESEFPKELSDLQLAVLRKKHYKSWVEYHVLMLNHDELRLREHSTKQLTYEKLSKLKEYLPDLESDDIPPETKIRLEHIIRVLTPVHDFHYPTFDN